MSMGCVNKKLPEPCIVMSLVGNHDNHHHSNNLSTTLLTPCSISALSVGSGFVPSQERAERRLITRAAAGYRAYGRYFIYDSYSVPRVPTRTYKFSSCRRPPHESETGAQPIHVKERLKKLCVTKFFKIQAVGNWVKQKWPVKQKKCIDNTGNTKSGTTGQTF